MTTPFLSSATGDPINLQRQIIGQPTRALPVNLPESGVSGWRDFRSNGGPVVFEPGEVERLVIAAGGQPQGNLPGKVNIANPTFEIGDVDPANYGFLHFLANLFGRYSNTDLTTYRRWNFALDQATVADAFMSYREWNDVLPGFRLTDLITTGMAVTAASNDNLAVNFPALASEYDFHGAITQTIGAGSTLPVFKRTWGSYAASTGNWAPDAIDQDLYLEIQTVATRQARGRVSSAAAYSDVRTFEYDQHNRFFNESGARAGVFAEQVRYYLPTGATLTDLDEFRVLKRMAKWTPSLAADRPIASINTAVILDGAEIRTEGGWEVSVERETNEFVLDVAGKQGGTVRKSGDLNAVITPTREVTDLTLQEAILAASQVSLVIDCVTDVEIPGAGRPYRVLMVAPQCRVFGSTYGVEAGGTNRTEQLRIVAEEPDATFNYDGLSFDAHFHVVIENDIAAL